MPEQQFLKDEAATIAAAQRLAPALNSGDMVLLSGDLGTGKSTFARALIRALPGADGQIYDDEPIPSPTYTLVQTYDRALGTVGHFDLYRLSEPEEIWDLGLEDILEQGVALIEWPERLGPLIPTRAIHIHLKDQGEGRCLAMRDQRG